MKKLSALFFAIMILVAFAGCGKKTPEPARTKNTLVLTDESKTLLGARARFNDVISVVKEEVRILEDSHNENIRLAEPDNYFLNENYILSSFDPFNIADLSLTDYFDDSLDEASAALYYEIPAAGRNVVFERDGSEFILKFSGEDNTDTYTADYDKKSDSFIFTHSRISDAGEELIDFLEFLPLAGNSYAVQSMMNRCYVSFDSDNRLDYFRFSSIGEGGNSPENGLFGSAAIITPNWVTKGTHDTYDSIVELENGVLTHTDSSSGTLREYNIREADYESAFQMF